MTCPTIVHAAFGPFDGDFDPFEDEDEVGGLIPLERTSHPKLAVGKAIHGVFPRSSP